MHESFKFNLLGNVCAAEIGSSYWFTLTSKREILVPPLFFIRHICTKVQKRKKKIFRFYSNHFHSHDDNFRGSRELRMEFKTFFFRDSSKMLNVWKLLLSYGIDMLFG
jgi:hypothetical protein